MSDSKQQEETGDVLFVASVVWHKRSPNRQQKNRGKKAVWFLVFGRK
jgi:hypothetical protein